MSEDAIHVGLAVVCFVLTGWFASRWRRALLVREGLVAVAEWGLAPFGGEQRSAPP